MTIKLSDGRELHCNRMIVFPQCDFFRAALEPGRFKVRVESSCPSGAWFSEKD